MNRRKRIMVPKFFLVGVVLVSFFYGSIYARENHFDINSIVKETQKMTQSAEELTLVWWLPEEFWEASFSQNETITDAQIESFMSVLRPYTIVAVVDGKLGAFGGVTYSSSLDISSSIRIIDKDRNHYMPLAENKIDPDVINFMAMMKPVLKNMLGPMGENIHFFIFPGKTLLNEDIAQAKKEGFFTVKHAGKEFKWRLPLGSVLPPKRCSVDGEMLNGAWRYCPWHGVELK